MWVGESWGWRWGGTGTGVGVGVRGLEQVGDGADVLEGVRDVEQRCGGVELSESEFWRFGAEVWREQKCGRRNQRGGEVQNWSFEEWRCRIRVGGGAKV